MGLHYSTLKSDCAASNEKGLLQTWKCKYLVPSWWHCSGTLRRFGFARPSVLGGGFENSRPLHTPSLSSLLLLHLPCLQPQHTIIPLEPEAQIHFLP